VDQLRLKFYKLIAGDEYEKFTRSNERCSSHFCIERLSCEYNIASGRQL
jgi:hypothetical protein